MVFVTVADPMAQGLIASLAHPGGNATGFTNFEFSLGSKWLETLKELAPQTKRVGLLLNPPNPTIPLFLEPIRSSGISFDVEPVMAPARSRDEIESAMMKVAGPGGGLNAGDRLLPPPHGRRAQTLERFSGERRPA
jgi:ABC-type uncharacterized transport system substrate-binding protein